MATGTPNSTGYIGDEVTLRLGTYIPTSTAITMTDSDSSTVFDSSASSVQKYTKVDEVLAQLAGRPGKFSAEGLSTDKYSDGQASLAYINGVDVSESYILLSSSEGPSIRRNKGEYVKGDVALNVVTLQTLPGITALNVTPSASTSQIGTADRQFANTWTSKLDNIGVYDEDNQVLSTTSQNLVGAINEINGGLSAIDLSFHASFKTLSTATNGTVACDLSGYLPDVTSGKQYLVLIEAKSYDSGDHGMFITSDCFGDFTTNPNDYAKENTNCLAARGTSSLRHIYISSLIPVMRYIYFMPYGCDYTWLKALGYIKLT